MATWQNTSLTMLRTILNDAGCSNSDYTTSRLEELLITAAYFLPLDINFNNSYTVNVETKSISPNPISQTDGTEFISFMVLKAACMVDQSNFRNAALLQGVTARCGPAVLQTNAYGQYLKDLLTNGPCKSYEDLKQEYNFSYAGRGIIRAVMSPFVSNDFFPPHGGEAGHGMLDTNNPIRNRSSY